MLYKGRSAKLVGIAVAMAFAALPATVLLAQSPEAGTDSVDSKLAQIRQGDPAKQMQAMRELGEAARQGNQRALDALAGLLGDRDERARRYAIMGLTRYAGDAGVPVAIQAMNSSDARVRAGGAQILASPMWSRRAPSKEITAAADRLLKLTEDPDAAVRRSAVVALASVAPDKALDPLVARTEDSDPLVRRSALFALGLLKGPGVAEVLERFLAHDDESLRVGASYALRSAGREESIPKLRPLLKDPAEAVRQAAMGALLGLGDAQALVELMDTVDKADARDRRRLFYELASFGAAWDTPLDQAARRSLQQTLAKLDFKSIPLRDALQFFQDASKGNLYADWRALREVGLRPEAGATFALSDVPLAYALLTCCRSAAANPAVAIRVVDGVIVVSSVEGSKAIWEWHRSLVKSRLQGAGSESTLRQLEERRTDLQLDSVPLSATLDAVGKAAGVPVKVEWEPLQSCGVGRSTSVSLKLKDAPVLAALHLALLDSAGPGGLRYAIQDNQLVVLPGRAGPPPAQEPGLTAAEEEKLIEAILGDVRPPIEKATKLYDAAGAAGSESVRSVLLEKSLEYGTLSSSIAGCQIAENAFNALLRTDPKKAEALGQERVELYRRWYQLTRGQPIQPSVGSKLVAALMDFGDGQARAGDELAAIATFRQAYGVASEGKLPEADRVLDRHRAMLHVYRSRQNVQRYVQQLKQDPRARAARESLVRALVVDLDDPSEAAKYLHEDLPETWRTHLSLAVRPAAEQDAEACLKLGDWYYQLLAPSAPDPCKLKMLNRARGYYARYLQARPKQDAEYLAAKIKSDQLTKLISDLSGESSAGAPEPAKTQRSIYVLATKGWQSTGWIIPKGAKLAIRAEGLWSADGGHWVDADDPGMRLLGRIGAGEFSIGKNWNSVVQEGGELQLRPRDDWRGDNEGHLAVSLRCEPAPKDNGRLATENVAVEPKYEFAHSRTRQDWTTKVSATTGWQDSGLEVEEGKDLVIRAAGHWGTDERDRTSDPGRMGMRLICKITQAPQSPHYVAFIVGTGARLRVPLSGRMLFRCEDSGLENNHGEVTVAIRGTVRAP